jgi:hypothetical protein
MDSAAHKIERMIQTFERGRIFFADDFVELGSSDAIRQTLLRLTKSGLIVRVAQGIYCYPEIDEKLGLGVICPTFEQIATALAERLHARIVPTGEYALNMLGLSTQVSMNCVFLTDGTPRSIEIADGRGITFKKTAPKNLSFKSRLAMLINSALKSIKQENVTDVQIARIHDLLRYEDQSSIMADLKLMPVWICNIITNAYE